MSGREGHKSMSLLCQGAKANVDNTCQKQIRVTWRRDEDFHNGGSCRPKTQWQAILFGTDEPTKRNNNRGCTELSARRRRPFIFATLAQYRNHISQFYPLSPQRSGGMMNSHTGGKTSPKSKDMVILESIISHCLAMVYARYLLSGRFHYHNLPSGLSGLSYPSR